MKKSILLFSLLFVFAFAGTLSAQENQPDTTVVEATADSNSDNPGIGILDRATDAKLRASTILDLGQVIALCQRAKKAGLSGENLEYCNQLLASSQLQRGLFLANSLLGDGTRRFRDIEAIRKNALLDLEEAVTVIKDQPNAYLRMAQLYLLAGDEEERAKDVLNLAVSSAIEESDVQVQAIRLLALLEPDAEKRAEILGEAVHGGDPQIRMEYAALLIDLKRFDEAYEILKNLAEDAESGDIEMQARIFGLVTGLGERQKALEILDTLRAKEPEDRQDRIDLVKAELLMRMNQYDDAMTLVNALYDKYKNPSEEQADMPLLALLLRSTIHLAKDNIAEALKDIESAEEWAEGSGTHSDLVPRILVQKYSILMEQEKTNDALTVAKKLQTLEPNVPLHFNREIQVLIAEKKYREAVEVVEKLQKNLSEYEQMWNVLLIDIYSKQEDYDKALSLVEEQLKEEPLELRWIASKVKIFTDQKKWDEAIRWIESCLKNGIEKEHSETVNLLLVEVYFGKKDYKGAKDRLKPLLEKSSDNLTLLRMDSQISISLGLYSDAVKTLAKIVEAVPDDYTSINNWAWILCTSPIDSVRNGKKAVELAERAAKLSEYKKSFVLSTLAASYAEIGDFDKAKEWSKKSIDVAKTEKDSTEEERKELIKHLQEEWETFNSGKPYREYLDDPK